MLRYLNRQDTCLNIELTKQGTGSMMGANPMPIMNEQSIDGMK